MKTTINHYSNRTIWIHWLSALLIFGLIYTGISMEHAPLDENKFLLYKIHFSIGNLVFILTIIRVFALFKDSKPLGLYPKKSKREIFRKFVYKGFYVVIFWMSISGLVSLSLEGILPALQSGNLKDLPDIAKEGLHPIMLSHHVVAKLIFLLLIFHLGGFLIHFFQKKENTLKRIWFPLAKASK
tara:strand:+ start:411 stop:962 length:552 start_codon:yes stop_codon:yes gene_type:complete